LLGFKTGRGSEMTRGGFKMVGGFGTGTMGFLKGTGTFGKGRTLMIPGRGIGPGKMGFLTGKGKTGGLKVGDLKMGFLTTGGGES